MTSTATPFDRLSAAVAERYAVERELGHGGMATVYLARDLKHDRLVALKLLNPELAAALGPERFLREIQIAARLQHPHILGLIDSGTVELGPGVEGPFYVMPYVEGESLRDRLDRERQLPLQDALAIVRDVAAALTYAHDHGLVHRDIKPENILLGYPSRDRGATGAGQAVLADFGIARAVSAAGGEKLTATGLALGTPAYMSPEQTAGDSKLDGRADIYSLGCVLYEMLAGEPPFTGPSAQAVLARHAIDPVPRLQTIRQTVPDAIEQAIARALAKAPVDRFTTADQFAAALSIPAPTAVALQRRAVRRRPWLVGAAAAVLFSVAAIAWLVLRTTRPLVEPSASVIAVLPPAPSVPDTALARLGRDLALTIGASLDGVGEIRTVDAHTILGQLAEPTVANVLVKALALGRRFGAGSVVHGSVVRVGPNVRLDLGLYGTDSSAAGLEPIARVSATNSPDSLGPLTDSVAHALLRQVWQRGAAPTPSLEAALETRSVPALRAFLEAEHAMIQGHWRAAATEYERTIEADSTFWLAYARDGYARRWGGEEPDSAIAAAAEAHRSALPESDRLVVESNRLAWNEDSVSAGLALAERITERFPDDWFGWMNRADLLVHLGPHVGFTRQDAIAALQQTLSLAPGFVPGWEHLVWMYLQEHDTAGTARALGALTRLDAGPALGEDCFECNYLMQVRLLRAADRPSGAEYRALVDSVVRDVTDHFWSITVLPLWYGLQRPLIDVNRRVLPARSGPEVVGTLRVQIIRAWAARGAWDSALVAMSRYTGSGSDPELLLINYRLAVAGVLVDAIDPEEAIRWGDAVRSVIAPGSPDAADLAWLDGELAAHRGDRSAVAAARRALREAGPDAALLDQSLAASDLALAGNVRGAGRSLAALEWRLAERPIFWSPRETCLMAFDRLAGSRWLLAAGDTAQAARLLTWHEAVDASSIAAVLAPLVYLERARIEEGRGQVEAARAHYGQFLRRYDLPNARHRHLVQEARAALGRLPGGAEPAAAR